MALRRTADRVDDQMRAYMEHARSPARGPRRSGCWSASVRGALSERLIRTARRLADELNAEWFAIYVETPDHARMSQAAARPNRRILHLAEELGDAMTVPSIAVAETAFVHMPAPTTSPRSSPASPSRSRWLEFLRGSVVDQIIRQSGNIDVYVISGEVETSPVVKTRDWQPHRPFRRYLTALALVAGATLLGFPIHTLIDPANLVMLYLLVVVVAAAFWDGGPRSSPRVFGVLALDFFFVPPPFTFAVTNTQ